ncbi:hypothetical protein Slin14017_G038040 [Septoria linicola]|nr:hypothetical protein Slin14017_G038040 [Septoria linicola]
MTSNATQFCPLLAVSYDRTTSTMIDFEQAFIALEVAPQATPMFTVMIDKYICGKSYDASKWQTLRFL